MMILVYTTTFILYITGPNPSGDIYSPKAGIVKIVKHKED